MKKYIRPRNTTKAINDAKYEQFKKQCMKVTSLCALAVLNDLWDATDEEMQEWYNNFELLMNSIYHGVDSLDHIEKELKERCGIVFEEK